MLPYIFLLLYLIVSVNWVCCAFNYERGQMRKTVQRDMGLIGAISIGIGGMVGGGIFAVLGEAVSIAHGATAIAFIIAGFVAFLTAYSYAKLSVTYQSSGGTIVFIDKAFNHSLFSSSMNFLLWLSYLVTISLYAVAFSSYALTFFAPQESVYLKHIFITLAIALPALINLINASIVSKSETIIVFIKLLLMGIIIVVGMPYVEFERMNPAQFESPLSIVAAGMIIFVAYEGFELIANAAENIKEPEKNLPRAFFGSVIFVIILYVLISIVTVGCVNEADLVEAKDYALALAAKPALGQFGFTLVAIAALLATFSAINATIFGNARLSFILAIEGKLPLLDKKESSNPFYGVLSTSLLSIIMANSIDLDAIAIIGSASFLLIFSVVNLSAYLLHVEIKGKRWVFALAFLISVSALLTLLVHTYQSSPEAIGIFFSFIALSVLFETLYGKYQRKKFLEHKS